MSSSSATRRQSKSWWCSAQMFSSFRENFWAFASFVCKPRWSRRAPPRLVWGFDVPISSHSARKRTLCDLWYLISLQTSFTINTFDQFVTKTNPRSHRFNRWLLNFNEWSGTILNKEEEDQLSHGTSSLYAHQLFLLWCGKAHQIPIDEKQLQHVNMCCAYRTFDRTNNLASIHTKCECSWISGPWTRFLSFYSSYLRRPSFDIITAQW